MKQYTSEECQSIRLLKLSATADFLTRASKRLSRRRASVA